MIFSGILSAAYSCGFGVALTLILSCLIFKFLPDRGSDIAGTLAHRLASK